VLFSIGSGQPCPGRWGLVLPRCIDESMLSQGAPGDVTSFEGTRLPACLRCHASPCMGPKAGRGRKPWGSTSARVQLDLWLLCWSMASGVSRKSENMQVVISLPSPGFTNWPIQSNSKIDTQSELVSLYWHCGYEAADHDAFFSWPAIRYVGPPLLFPGIRASVPTSIGTGLRTSSASGSQEHDSPSSHQHCTSNPPHPHYAPGCVPTLFTPSRTSQQMGGQPRPRRRHATASRAYLLRLIQFEISPPLPKVTQSPVLQYPRFGFEPKDMENTAILPQCLPSCQVVH
jgi:hypothetical protein